MAGVRFQVLCVLMLGGSATADTLSFDTPSDDRWFYPFNFTPGVRPIASCFAAAGVPFFNDRDGEMLIAWDTTSQIEPGLGPDAYPIKSIRVVLTTAPDGEWLEDLTTDEWYTFDVNQDGFVNADGIPRGQPGDTDGESTDTDPGRTMELFGVGFGPTYTPESWTEFSVYIGSDSLGNKARDPFPFVYQDGTSDLLHVEDSIKGLHNDMLPVPVFNFTPAPWSIGVPQGYTPGDQDVPFDVTFDIDLQRFDGRARQYFQEQLDAGRLFVCVTSMTESSIFAPQNGYPIFYTKEGLVLDPAAKAPYLEITFCESGSGDADADCDVDLDDYAAFQDCVAGPQHEPGGTDCGFADIDNDDDVDLLDFGGFQRSFTGAQ